MIRGQKLGQSFKHAWEGLALAFRQEPSFRWQLLAALGVTTLALLLPLQRWELALLTLVIGGVLVLELGNSIIERLVDALSPRVMDYAKHLKDLSAAAVLVMACTAVVLSVIIFWPYLSLIARV